MSKNVLIRFRADTSEFELALARMQASLAAVANSGVPGMASFRDMVECNLAKSNPRFLQGMTLGMWRSLAIAVSFIAVLLAVALFAEIVL